MLQLPYLYHDKDHMWKVLDGKIGQDLLNGMNEKANVVGLSWYDAGARSFYITDHEINSLDDLQGLKIRVQESSLMVDMIKALGADPVPMTYQGVEKALEDKTIDGAENNWSFYESSNHYKIAKYYVVDEHTRIPEIQMVSKKVWDSLSSDDQKLIRECAIESAEFEKGEFEKREQLAQENLAKNGVVVINLTPEVKEEFVEAMKSVYDEYGANIQDLITAIQETK